MSAAEHFENVILGGGAAGKLIFWDLAGAGRRTAVIERALIGGSCPNIACMPSKNVIHSAKVAQFLRHAAEFGLRAGPATTDMAGVRQRKRAMVEGMVAIHQTRFAANGLEFILGEGRFIAPMTIEVWLAEGGTRRLEAERVFLDVGTHATVPDIRRFGSEVTVVERGPQLAAREDPDVAAAIRTIFLEDGIELALDTEPVGVEGSSGEKVRLRVATNDGERVIEGSDLLVAAGRTPNTDGIGLDVAGVELDPRGYVKVDERLETTAPGVWAMGECAGSPQFTHAAVDDFRVVRDNLAGQDRTTRDRLIPYCVFIDPELARVGLSEREAERRGIKAQVARLPMNAVLRARTIGETRGFMKALIDPHSEDILGFAMLGAEAGEVVAVVQTAMLAELRYTGLRDAILTHPTMAEGLNELFASVSDQEKR